MTTLLIYAILSFTGCLTMAGMDLRKQTLHN